MDPIKKKAKGIIEVTTFTFVEKLPRNRELRLSKCLMPLRERVPGYFSALHGYASKNEALMLARQHAAANNLHMLTANLYLYMRHPLTPGFITKESLRERSFVSTARLASGLVEELAEFWKESLVDDRSYGIEQLESIYRWDRPESFVVDHPRYVAALFKKWRQVKVIAHQARFEFADKPIMIATFLPTKSLIVGVEVDPTCSDVIDTVVNDVI